MSIPSEQILPPLRLAPWAKRFGALAPALWAIALFAVLLDAALLHVLKLHLAGLVSPGHLSVLALVLLGPMMGARHRRMGLIAETCGLFMCLLLAGEILSYPVTMAGLPLHDGDVLAMDRALGFDWLSAMRAMDRHPAAILVLRFAYLTIWAQGLVVLIVLACRLRRREIEKLLFAFAGCYAATIAIAIFFPVLGVVTQFPGAEFRHLQFQGGAIPIPFAIALRNGTLHTIDMANFRGLIVMPSFHAAMAVLWTWAAWRGGALFWLVLPLNILMAFAALTEGGHYLCDILIGMALAAATAAIVEYRDVWAARRELRRMS